jgi:hypothetical protein
MPHVMVRVEASQDISSELGGARFKSDLLERAFGVTLGFEGVRRTSYDSPFTDNEPSISEIDAASLPG